MTQYEKISDQLTAAYQAKRPISAGLHQKARAVMPGGDTRTITYFKPYPSFMSHGKGCRMWDADGNEYLDFQGNYTSLIHGHAFGPVVSALQEQAAKGTAFAAPLALQTELSAMICERIPGIQRIRYCNSGTEATMHAVRGARAYTGRDKIVKLEGGYHGSSDLFEASVEPDLELAGTLEHPVPVADSKGVSQSSLNQVLVAPLNEIEITRRIIEERKEDIAAFIMEPIQGSAGMIEPEPDYLSFVREITSRYGIVLIFDEVVTFRVTTGGAQKYYGITPDMTTLGKIIGGGIPVGAFGGSAELMEIYDPARKIMSHSGTFNGNALAMAGGLAALDHYGTEEVNRLNLLGETFRGGLSAAAKDAGLDLRINGVASLCNVIFSNRKITEYRGLAHSHESLNVLLGLALMNRGIFMAPRGMMALSTPMELPELDRCITAFHDSLMEIKPAVSETAPELVL